MCQEYWDEWQEIQEIEERARKKAEELIQKANVEQLKVPEKVKETVLDKENEAA